MTLPDERLRALKCGKQFLYDLINPKSTPRVPKEVRQRALWVLRHYPDDYHIDLISKRLPEWFNEDSFPRLVNIQEKTVD
jgi:hypothetical protein